MFKMGRVLLVRKLNPTKITRNHVNLILQVMSGDDFQPVQGEIGASRALVRSRGTRLAPPSSRSNISPNVRGECNTAMKREPFQEVLDLTAQVVFGMATSRAL